MPLRERHTFCYATRYRVRDATAYLFAAEFYRGLMKDKMSILGSFRSAAEAVLDANARKPFSEKMRTEPDTLMPSQVIANRFRSGINTEPTRRGTVEHPRPRPKQSNANEWLAPQIKDEYAADFSNAFTCGRLSLSNRFGDHWKKRDKKKVLHYFMCDDTRQVVRRRVCLNLCSKTIFRLITGTRILIIIIHSTPTCQASGRRSCR